MSWKDDVINRIGQLENNSVSIINSYPKNENFDKSKYRKAWVSVIFVDVVGYTKYCEDRSDKDVAIMIRTFHEGILAILNHYEFDHIDIQGDGIFGVMHAPKEDSYEDMKVIDTAMDINGFLRYVWDYTDYKISVTTSKELMLVVGQSDDRKVVFAGGAVNAAKKQMDENETKNAIIYSSDFVQNNTDNFYNEHKRQNMYGTKDFYSNTYLSHWYNKAWEK